MSSNEFSKLVKKRKDWVRSSKENKFDFDSILSGLYNDPSHFIYEILQNAEDAGASKISFNLFSDHLEIIHNAKKDFDFPDVDRFKGVDITISDFDNINPVFFDAQGAPSKGGSATLALGSSQIVVTMDALTGKVSVSE